MPKATGRDLYVDLPLSNVVVGRRPQGYIADQLLPVTPVGKQSGSYWKFNHLENRRWEKNLSNRAPATEARHVEMTVSSDGYFVQNYALKTSWPVEDEVNADGQIQWARSAAMHLTDRLLMDYEKRVADFCLSSSNVGTIFVAASAWTDKTNSEPLTDMLSWHESFRQITGMTPNLAIIPQGAIRHLALNNQLRDVLYGDRGGIINGAQLASLFNVDRVLIPQIQINTAAETAPGVAQTGTLADVWGTGGHVWLARVDTLAGMYTDTWLNAFRWTNPALGTPWAVQRYPFDAKKKCYEVEVGYYQSEKVISSDLAIRISSLY